MEPPESRGKAFKVSSIFKGSIVPFSLTTYNTDLQHVRHSRAVRIVCRTKRYLESKLGAKEVLVVGSGGVEKNIDLMLCRRFKGRGMSWSRAGVQNLLKLRLLRYGRKDWNVYWRRRVN